MPGNSPGCAPPCQYRHKLRVDPETLRHQDPDCSSETDALPSVADPYSDVPTLSVIEPSKKWKYRPLIQPRKYSYILITDVLRMKDTLN